MGLVEGAHKTNLRHRPWSRIKVAYLHGKVYLAVVLRPGNVQVQVARVHLDVFGAFDSAQFEIAGRESHGQVEARGKLDDVLNIIVRAGNLQLAVAAGHGRGELHVLHFVRILRRYEDADLGSIGAADGVSAGTQLEFEV